MPRGMQWNIIPKPVMAIADDVVSLDDLSLAVDHLNTGHNPSVCRMLLLLVFGEQLDCRSQTHEPTSSSNFLCHHDNSSTARSWVPGLQWQHLRRGAAVWRGRFLAALVASCREQAERRATCGGCSTALRGPPQQKPSEFTDMKLVLRAYKKYQTIVCIPSYSQDFPRRCNCNRHHQPCF